MPSNKINESMSASGIFTWSRHTCHYLLFESVFLKMEFLWSHWIYRGWCFLVCLICSAFCPYFLGHCFNLALMSDRICKWPASLCSCHTKIRLVQKLISSPVDNFGLKLYSMLIYKFCILLKVNCITKVLRK